jgi:hypothetical protein
MKAQRAFRHQRKLSKKAALLITRELWQWLADEQGTCKSDWPRWSRIQRIYGRFEADCPCCAYAVQERITIGIAIDRCQYCPLEGYAWSQNGRGSPTCQYAQASPYTTWCANVRSIGGVFTDNAVKKMARRSAALRIVEGCNKALHELEAATKGKEVNNG